MTKSTTRRFLCCLLALCCLLGSLTAFSLAAGTSYPYSASVNADTNLRRSPLVGGEQHHRPYPEGNDSDRHGRKR